MKTKIKVYMDGNNISKIVSDDSNFEIEVIKNNKSLDYKDIKTFEDACNYLDIDSSVLPDISMIDTSLQKSLISNYKLCIIYKAINKLNNWVPDYKDSSQYKYYPYFKVSGSGFGFSGTHFGYDGTVAFVGVRLCTYSIEVAKYIGMTFIKEYEDYLL
jgi:hypothetical protein